MADIQSPPPSTVAPGDSASSSGKKKKPGKAERAARRSVVNSVAGAPASTSKAAAFATGGADVVPQPGKFPVVFQSGAGEPSRDLSFAVTGESLDQVLNALPSRFSSNAKFAEFRAHSEMTGEQFTRRIVVSALLRLSQQFVHCHVNMGLPQGDFAPLASSDVRVPSSVAAYLQQYGEFSVPALGTRFLLADYENTVKRCVWAAKQVNERGSACELGRFWLPMSSSDAGTKAIIAERLNSVIEPSGMQISVTELEGAVFSGTVPDAWEQVKVVLGDPPDEGETDVRDRFDFVFKSYADVGQFTTAFTTTAATAARRELRLAWDNPSAGHLDWGLNVKEVFTKLADEWAKLSTTFAQFFEMSSSQTVRQSASGSQAQMAVVNSVEGVSVVKTHLALSAPEFSLVSCFPVTCLFSGGLARRVVVTTPLSVSQRATEFCQLDWR
nr:coat protein [Beauveria bassiana partitivirus 1]